MIVKVFRDKHALGKMAALQAGTAIAHAIAQRGKARVIAATGASQFEFLEALIQRPEVDWRAVELFHLDEYIGLPETHPASFRKYLRERLVGPAGIAEFHELDGTRDAAEVCRKVGAALQSAPVDVAFVGIGENGHLAFNDPPADFATGEPYLVVELDEPCRRQQLGEGWFATLEDVPRRAISMSIRQILRAREILCVVPDLRKAEAARNCLEREVDPRYPASALRTHGNCTALLDEAAASLLGPGLRQGGELPPQAF